MTTTTAILSLLHEPPQPGCARRLFRAEPVLAWTLRRLRRCARLTNIAILCWDDQLEPVREIAAAHGVFVLARSPRVNIPHLEAVAAAQRWTDGWRGGLLGSTCFDLGFHAAWMAEITRQFQSDFVLIVNPDAALVDPTLLDGLVEHARAHPALEFCFSPAAPGLSGALLRTTLLEKFAAGQGCLGPLLCYHPDLPGRDPISQDECAPVPIPVARSTQRFTIDSHRQLRRIERATLSLNGSLLSTESERLVARLAEQSDADPWPRDLVLELNTTRSTRPVYSPGRYLPIDRPDLSLNLARSLFQQLSTCDDLRLTLAGAGDPLLAGGVFHIIDAAREAGINAIHLETDLVGVSEETLARLAGGLVDVLSVHLPATTPQTYQSIMGIDGYRDTIENIRLLLNRRQAANRGRPIIVPTFTKCRENLHEMEDWYDHWIRAIGCAVILSPSDFAGRIPDVSVADMAPPKRIPCRRLASRLTILSDGQIVPCEQDVTAAQPLGRLNQTTLAHAWTHRLPKLRAVHLANRADALSPCAHCRDWHRP